MINLMLDDGLPYHVIIDELGEPGQGLNVGNLAKWFQSGYLEHVRNSEQIHEIKTQAEFAADLVKELGKIDASVIHRASLALTAVQIFTAIDKYGDEALRKMFETKPESFISVTNALCNTIGPTIALEKHDWEIEDRAEARAKANAQGVPPPRPGGV